jgi:hypothetical protein
MIMRLCPRPLPTLGLALAATALMAACSNPPAEPTPTATPGPTASAAASTTSAPGTADPSTAAATPSGEVAAGVEPVSCGEVGPDGGAQVDLIADATPAGRVGCTEAITVISDYYRDAPTMSEGTGHHLVVDGWACAADTGAYGSGSIGCSKDGFAFHTEP